VDQGETNRTDDCSNTSSAPDYHTLHRSSVELRVGDTEGTFSKHLSGLGGQTADFTTPKQAVRRKVPAKPAFHNDSVSSLHAGQAWNIKAEAVERVTFKPTPVSTKKLSLTAMLLKWCYPPSASECCTFHTALRDLRELSVDMKLKSRCLSGA